MIGRRSASALWLWLLCQTAVAAVGDAPAHPSDTLPVRQLLQTAAYIGVDYQGAVSDGSVVDQTEYAEMVEFAAALARGIDDLPASPGSADLAASARALIEAIGRQASRAEIQAITARIQAQLLQNYPVPVLPAQTPDLTLGQRLYAADCAACHGATGGGDGPAANALEPRPTNFHDRSAGDLRSLYGIYNTITIGVANTAMPSFAKLGDHERWSLAFYVARFHDGPADAAAEAAWQAQQGKRSPESFITSSDADLRAAAGSAGALVWLRAHPELLLAESTRANAITFTKARIESSLQSWRAGDRATAYEQALSAYLDGFETVEPTLAGIDSTLMHDTEQALMAYRAALQSNAAEETVLATEQRAVELLDASANALHAGSLGNSVTFASSFVILAREGLEAILLLAAMLVFLRRMAEGKARRRALGAVHVGWVVALLAGLATWSVSNWLIEISGATRELTEGVTALIAAAVLIWVALWMHSQVAIREWSGFVTGRLEGALHQRSRWVLFGLAFLAVYREVFETILFYQALWLQIGTSGRAAMLGGIAAATGFLLLAVWAILRAGAKLPIRQFFTFCAYTVLVLAVIFTGKGIAALQESGVIAQTLVDVPTVSVLGVYPSVQGIGAQLLVLVFTVVWLQRQRRAGRA